MTKSAKSRKGPTGPRTAAGKAKSARNATKHRIFTIGVSTEEDEATTLLTAQITDEFKLRGALELEIGHELARNRLETKRINAYADQELDKAEILAGFNLEHYDTRYTKQFRYAIPSTKTKEHYRSRLCPRFCIPLLIALKELIAKRGPRPADDLGFLWHIYGDELSPIGSVIAHHYTTLESNGRMGVAEVPNQEIIIRCIELEIETQNIRAQFDDVEDQLDSVPGFRALPVESLMDRIQKYRTANAREFGRSLQNLETVRRLKE
jgi:hypothetical protein